MKFIKFIKFVFFVYSMLTLDGIFIKIAQIPKKYYKFMKFISILVRSTLLTSEINSIIKSDFRYLDSRVQKHFSSVGQLHVKRLKILPTSAKQLDLPLVQNVGVALQLAFDRFNLPGQILNYHVELQVKRSKINSTCYQLLRPRPRILQLFHLRL